MAKSRRSRRPREKADWVYRGFVGNAYDQFEEPFGDTEASGLPSYSQFVVSQSAGAESAGFLVLYDSQNRMAHLMGTATTTSGASYGMLPGAGRAEGKRAKILATEGVMFLEPSTWALGNVLSIGMRLGAWDQDPETGLVSLPAAYSMWSNVTGSVQTDVSLWANSYNHVLERRFWRGFNTSESNIFPQRLRWRGRRTLRPNEAWGIYLEVPPTAVAIRRQSWFRSLVVDEG